MKMICQVSFLYLLLNICSAKDVPACFIFGDSLYDVGNNFYLKTLAKPYFPNGIDFFGNKYGVPSGRYTNEQELGLKILTPPYLAPTATGDVLLKGINYASSGAGIFNSSGQLYGERISLDQQISYFAKTRKEIIAKIGAQAAKELLNNAIYFVGIGSNDMLLNKEKDRSHTPKSVDTLYQPLLSTFTSQLAKLYSLDARKFVVANVPVLGCLPFLRDASPLIFDGCNPNVNQLIRAFNGKMKIMLEELTTNLIGSNYIYANTYAMTEDIVRNYISYGFEIVDEACCHLGGLHGGLIPCVRGSLVCQDRTKYVYWDAFHYTETAQLIMAKHMMDGGTNYMSPFNVRQLSNSSFGQRK
ncbi:hypothetical protein JCGZ_18986 [Jatropha curcas]|uniref:Uncharacterized protein n=1 Tax=Jatropha curcas TaxID=180498 RepID=A0A067JVA2_JATCU|nr:hypothetical protein JCGZ_18986 [Jatropha curcas]